MCFLEAISSFRYSLFLRKNKKELKQTTQSGLNQFAKFYKKIKIISFFKENSTIFVAQMKNQIINIISILVVIVIITS